MYVHSLWKSIEAPAHVRKRECGQATATSKKNSVKSQGRSFCSAAVLDEVSYAVDLITKQAFSV